MSPRKLRYSELDSSHIRVGETMGDSGGDMCSSPIRTQSPSTTASESEPPHYVRAPSILGSM
eukprot:4600942-Amphidinium_carterae.2